jgi:polyisoprenoid-binding protein YceI
MNKPTLKLISLAFLLPLLAACGKTESPQVGEGPVPIPPGTYAIDRNHSYVTFSYMHQGLSFPLLRATDIDGELELDSLSMDKSSVRIAVRADSIRTNMGNFDKELASRKFFHAEKFPYITFTTESYEPLSDTEGRLSGLITIRDVTKPLELAVTINGAMVHPMRNIPVIGFSATGSLNRADFDLDRFVPMIGNRVDLKIEAEFLQGSNEGSAAAAVAGGGGQ